MANSGAGMLKYILLHVILHSQSTGYNTVETGAQHSGKCMLFPDIWKQAFTQLTGNVFRTFLLFLQGSLKVMSKRPYSNIIRMSNIFKCYYMFSNV